MLHSEVDAFGYDVVFDCNGVVRHVQLKTSKCNAKTRKQKVNIALAEKPSGCVVWILRHEDQGTRRMKLTYMFFGGEAGQPLPSLDDFNVANHTKGNAQGIKEKRKAIRVIPRSKFRPIPDIRGLVETLFGLDSNIK